MSTRPAAFLAALVMAAFLAPHAPAAAPNDPALQERLDRLTKRLEQERQTLHIPGMALAIVKDDTVILSRGFGLADVESNLPASDQTLFAAGSTTKAFTATLVAMLVDEGRMRWDDPVRNYLPDFRLTDPQADAGVQVQDLLCHRIGWAPMDLLWYGHDVTAQDVLAAALTAELLFPFREKFSYSNVSYLAAGLALGNAAGADWHALIRDRIFMPLGMTSTDTSIEVALADPRTAKGYRWDADEKKLVHQPMRNAEAVAPAGAINSNVRDMIQWVRLQLGRGEYNGVRLVSAAQHQETWTSHIKVGGDINYGLGWFLRTWQGKPVIEHAGGIDGFTAEIAMLPEEHLGFVLLMNLFASPLQEGSRELVFAALLGPANEPETPAPAEDYQPFQGTYVGNFGQFKDADFKVLVQDGNLAIDVPGQMVYALKPPDAEGKRSFAITDQVAVRFNAGADTDVYSVTIFQSGYAFELMRRGAAAPVEIDLEAARHYLGVYHDDNLGDLTVLIRNNRLAVDVPKQMVYELAPPDQEGRWLFRVKDGLWVRFNEGDDGAVASLTMSQDGKQGDMPRLPGPTETLPTVQEVMEIVHAAMGADQAAGLGILRATGTINFVHMGARGTMDTVLAPDGRAREDIDLGKFGTIRTRLDRDSGWIDTPAMADTDMDPELREQARTQNLFVWLGDWRAVFAEMHVERKGDFEGQPAYYVSLKPSMGPSATLMVSTETGLPLAINASAKTVIGANLPMTTRFQDYRDVNGVKIPYRLDIENAVTGRTVVQYERYEAGVKVPDATFQRDPPAAGGAGS